jgi:hypothetical protein
MGENAESKPVPVRTVSRKTVWVLSAVIAVLSALLAWSVLSRALFEIETTLADEHARELEFLRDQVLVCTNVTEIADTLHYMTIYYAPDHEAVRRKRYESLLKRVRVALIREVIDHLRIVTGEDLGDEAAPWIATYAPTRMQIRHEYPETK